MSSTYTCRGCGKPTTGFGYHHEYPYTRDCSGRVPASREVIEAEVRDIMARKMAEGALEAEVTNTLTRTAYHEAGHAITALALGLRLDEVSLDVTADRWGEGDTRASGWSSRVQVAEVALGGAIAERGFLGDIGDGCGHDEAMVAAVMENGSVPAATSVRSIVELNRPAVKVIAEALLEHGTLSGGDVEALLSGVPSFRPGCNVDASTTRSALSAGNAVRVFETRAAAEAACPANSQVIGCGDDGYRLVESRNLGIRTRDFDGELHFAGATA